MIVKNRKTVKILLIVTILIWLLILYRIFNFSGQGEYIEPDLSGIVTIEDFDDYNDTFLLDLNYIDPFMKKARIKQSKGGSQTNKVVVKKRIDGKIKPITLPNILYSGYIINKKNNATLGLLQINNMEYLVTTGEEIQDVKVLRIYGDSIKVSYKGITKIIVK